MTAIESPYLSAAPARLRAVGDLANHCLRATDDRTVIIPIKFTTSSGSLSTQQATGSCWISDETGGVMRIYHPYSPADGTQAFFTQDTGFGHAVDASNASSGYTEVTVQGTGTFQGALVLRGVKGTSEARVTNGSTPDVTSFDVARDLSARARSEAFSPVHGLSIGFYRFTVDGSGDPIAGATAASGQFSVVHSGTGIYEIETDVEFNSSTVFVSSAGGTYATSSDGGNGKIEMTTANGISDPASGEEVTVMYLTARNESGILFALEQNTARPSTSRHCFDGCKAAWSPVRGATLIPFSVATDGSGNLLPEDANTVVPENLHLIKNGTAITVEMGRAQNDLTGCMFLHSGAATTFSGDRTNLESQGRIGLTATVTSEVLYGFILSSYQGTR